MKSSPSPELFNLPKLSPLSKTLYVNRRTPTPEKTKRHHPYKSPSTISMIKEEGNNPYPVMDPSLKEKFQNAYIGGYAIPVQTLSPNKHGRISRESAKDAWYDIYQADASSSRRKEPSDALAYPYFDVKPQVNGNLPQTPKRGSSKTTKSKDVYVKMEVEERLFLRDE